MTVLGRGVVLALFLAAPAMAESPVEIRATADPTSAPIGTPVRFEVEVLAPDGLEIFVAQPSERIGDLDILDFGTEPAAIGPDGRVSLKRWWKLVAWTTGSHVLETPSVSYRSDSDTIAPADPVRVTVDVPSVLGDAADLPDIKDIKPPLALPVDRRPYYAAAFLAALFVAAWLVVRYSSRRTRRRPFVPPPPPHVVATAAFAALRARKLPERGAFKEFYSSLSDIVRTYMEGRFGLRAPEMTTEEFLVATAKDFQLAVPHRKLLGDFLAESDLVKFARHRPSLDDSESAFAAARRFVEDTADVSTEARDAAG